MFIDYEPEGVLDYAETCRCFRQKTILSSKEAVLGLILILLLVLIAMLRIRQMLHIHACYSTQRSNTNN